MAATSLAGVQAVEQGLSHPPPPHLQTNDALAGLQLPFVEAPRLLLGILHADVDGGVEAFGFSLDGNTQTGPEPCRLNPAEGLPTGEGLRRCPQGPGSPGKAVAATLGTSGV